MSLFRLFLFLGLIPLLLVASEGPAQSGVFDIPHFVGQGHLALGLEPELNMTPSAGLGVNAKFTTGLSDWMDAQGIIGTGGGPRLFRIGGNTTFDIFPDIPGQPGIGIATQALYVRVPNDDGRLELTAIPYIHKAFPQGNNHAVEPFFAFPIGWGLQDGTYETIAAAVVGSIFKRTDSVSFSTELGVNVDHSSTYISGGIIFSH